MFDNIIKSFDHVTTHPLDWSRDFVDVVLLSNLLNFEIIIKLHIVEQYMSYIESLTTSIQAKSLGILQAVKHTVMLKPVLTE